MELFFYYYYNRVFYLENNNSICSTIINTIKHNTFNTFKYIVQYYNLVRNCLIIKLSNYIMLIYLKAKLLLIGPIYIYTPK